MKIREEEKLDEIKENLNRIKSDCDFFYSNCLKAPENLKLLDREGVQNYISRLNDKIEDMNKRTDYLNKRIECYTCKKENPETKDEKCKDICMSVDEDLLSDDDKKML